MNQITSIVLIVVGIAIVGLLVGCVVGLTILIERSQLVKIQLDIQAGQFDTITKELANIRTDLFPSDFNTGFAPGVWTSLDGKHTATTPEELLQKMESDPPINEDEAREQLKNFFENMIDGTDDDEPEEDWKKKK